MGLLSHWPILLGYYPLDPGCFTKTLGISDARLVTPTPLSNSMLSETPGGRVSTRLNHAARIACVLAHRIGTHQNKSCSRG